MLDHVEQMTDVGTFVVDTFECRLYPSRHGFEHNLDCNLTVLPFNDNDNMIIHLTTIVMVQLTVVFLLCFEEFIFTRKTRA